MNDQMLKPSLGEWLFWSRVIIDRLTTVAHIYNKPPHDDVFMAEQERQMKSGGVIELLRRLHVITDEEEIWRPRREGQERYHAQVIIDLQPAVKEVLRRLPAWSQDMQKLLKSPWKDNQTGKAAQLLFGGPDHRESEGIGTGMSENGRLPEVLVSLLEREQSGEGRATDESKDGGGSDSRRLDDLKSAWSKQNSGHLRSAGRMN